MNPNGSLYPNLNEFKNYNSNTQSSDTNTSSLYSNLYINPQHQNTPYVPNSAPPMYSHHPIAPAYPQYNYATPPTYTPPLYTTTTPTPSFNYQSRSDPVITSAPTLATHGEEIEEDEEPEERLSHSESLSREWRAMDRVLKKSDRIVTRFEHSMQRKNKVETPLISLIS